MTGSALALRPESVEVLDLVHSTRARVAQVIDVLPLDTAEDEAKARALLQTLSGILKSADKARTAEKAPYLKAGRDVDRTFGTATDPLEALEALLRRRVSEAALKREKARALAVQAAQAAAQVGDAVQANAAIVVANQVERAGITAGAGGGVAETLTWELDAVVDLRAVPVEFLALDMSRVRQEIATARREAREPVVPGLTFKRAVALTVRS